MIKTAGDFQISMEHLSPQWCHLTVRQMDSEIQFGMQEEGVRDLHYLLESAIRKYEDVKKRRGRER
jgi:hypothetical protein